jgi:hypothetical protein
MAQASYISPVVLSITNPSGIIGTIVYEGDTIPAQQGNLVGN